MASESLPLLGFHIVPENWDQNPKLGTVFQLYHKQTLYYSFKAADTDTVIRYPLLPPPASLLTLTSCQRCASAAPAYSGRRGKDRW